jgi:hypothetical protein
VEFYGYYLILAMILAGIGILCVVVGAIILALVLVIGQRTRWYGVAALLTGAVTSLAFAFFAAISEFSFREGGAADLSDVLSAAAIPGVVGFGIGILVVFFMVGFVLIVLEVRAVLFRRQLDSSSDASTPSS